MLPDIKVKKCILNRYTEYFTSHVPLYHTCYEDVPANIRYNIHNVTPEEFYKQISWYKHHFDIVSLDELFRRKYKGGCVAITFDDAYKSVFDNALPILEEFSVPAAVFVIGNTLNGEIFWRDKIRFIIANGLIKEFIRFARSKSNLELNINEDNFYKKTKSTSFLKRIHNQRLDNWLDYFFIRNNLHKSLDRYCVQKPEDLPNHPLLSYGNHTYNHYVLSTLSNKEIENDLLKNDALIKSLSPKKLVHVLSVPFGRESSLNNVVVDICKKLNYRGLLLSNNRLNGSFTFNKLDDFPVAYRYMVPGNLEKLKTKIGTMAYHKFYNKD